MRYTRKQAEAHFRKLAEFFGKPIGYKPGCWYFDYETVYGGGAVIEVTEDRHCCRIFTQHRLKPREFCMMCDAILEAVEMWQSRCNKPELQ